jgi:AcrR family transcriptional regulator
MASPPLRPALRERYDRRQQEVVDKAARVFAERGYHATSIDDLIAATGLTRGGLYHYIGSKQELLFRIHEELLEPLLDRARAILAEEADPETHLRRLVRAWVAHVESHRDHMLVFEQERRMVEDEPRWAEVLRTRREFEGLLAGVLDRGRREGIFALADPQLTLLALLGMVNYLPQWYDPAGRLDADAIATGYCDALLDGIRVRPTG